MSPILEPSLVFVTLPAYHHTVDVLESEIILDLGWASEMGTVIEVLTFSQTKRTLV